MTALARAVPLLVALAAGAAFLPALDAGFVDWDDDRNFLQNPGYRGLGAAQLRWMLTSTWMGHYIPLTWASLGLNYALGGMSPWGYHLGNLVLHAANAALLFAVGRRLIAAAFDGGDAAPAVATLTSGADARRAARALTVGAAVAALSWALHPLRAESVAWATERRDVLCGLFYLAAVLAYLRAVSSGARRRRWLGVSVAALACALASKAMAMTLPLTLLVIDVYPLRRRDRGWLALVREKLPHFVLAALAALVATWAVTRGAAWTSYETYGLPARLALTAYSFWFHAAKLVWPEGLSPLYEMPARIDLLDPRFLGPCAGVLAITALLLALRRRFPAGLAAWTHALVVLAPVSGMAHAGHQLAHDRYGYLASLGAATIAGGAVTWLLRARHAARVSRWVTAATLAGVALALAGLGAAAWEQTKIWHDSETLWRAAVAADPACSLCRHKLGNVLLAAGRHAEAEAELGTAAALRPDRAGPLVSLGALLTEQRRHAEAEAALREAIRRGPNTAAAYANLGALTARGGDHAEAAALLRHALVLAPWHDEARDNLARALTNVGAGLAKHGRLPEAIAAFREATQLRQDDADAWRNLGQALVEQGNAAEAVPMLERATQIRPRGPAERFWLARAYLLSGRPADAQPHITVLRELDPTAASALAASPSR
ncbi:MAG: tetratricopeptide repeat protein [Candidatus Rokuibacteriota bacterium]